MQHWQGLSSFLIFCYYFTCLKAREISCKIGRTGEIFLILHLSGSDNNLWMNECSLDEIWVKEHDGLPFWGVNDTNGNWQII